MPISEFSLIASTAPASTSLKTRRRAKKRDPGPPNGGVHLIYKIEGKPNEVDVFKLGLLLESLGNLLIESNRLTSGEATDVSISVTPFEKGSFVMDFVLQVRQNAGFLLLLSQTDEAQQLKALLEDIGLIQRITQKGVGLLQLLKALGTEKPTKIEQKGPDEFAFHSDDGTVSNVSMQVNKLYNNGVINNYIMPAIGAPLQGDGVSGITTFLKGASASTAVKLKRDDASWIQAYIEPEDLPILPERLENETVQLLHPKSGNYGENSGTWTFTIAGSRRTMKATITHTEFLAKYTRGIVRFFTGDTLKARVREVQIIDEGGESVTNEIIEVLEYRPARSRT